MSLSRPVKFPLLKLPWLCIKRVLHNSDEFDLIYFATISNRTRRIVRSSNYPLKGIEVGLGEWSKIRIKDQLGKTENEKSWYFVHDNNANGRSLLLKINSQSFRSIEYFDCWEDHYLHSYTDGDKLDALKMGIDFLIDVFGCTVSLVSVAGNKLSELVRLGISPVQDLYISYAESVNITDLKFLLENIKVTNEYVFCVPISEDFSCDPQIFKCRKLDFGCKNSADWVTLELLCQLDVPQLNFFFHRFSVEDIVSYITHWFNSENGKIEYVQFELYNPSQEDFKIEHLNPMPFSEKRRNRCPFVGEWKGKDMSSGMDILRQDGLLATFYVDSTSVVFYVWHKRFPDPV
ncbi:unnamed protein product [Caenorhabditis brenneri]